VKLTPEQTARIEQLAQRIIDMIGLTQGSFECHVSGGVVKAISVLDKSIKFG
jgi:hypothetical protein